MYYFVIYLFFKDPTYSSGKFGEVKDLLLGMLDTCNYEKVRHLVQYKNTVMQIFINQVIFGRNKTYSISIPIS